MPEWMEGNALILLWIFLFIPYLPSSPLFPLPPFNLQNLHFTTIAFKLNVVELISVTIPSLLHRNILCASIKKVQFEWNHNCIDNCQQFFLHLLIKKTVMSFKLFSWGWWCSSMWDHFQLLFQVSYHTSEKLN